MNHNLKCWRLISDEYYRLPLHNYWQLYGDEGPSRAWLDAARRIYEKTQLDGDKI